MFKVFTGNSNEPLARDICRHLSVPLGNAKVRTFSDGEVMVEIGENVRGVMSMSFSQHPLRQIIT